MRLRKLPRDLMVRLRRYYTFYYARKTAFDEEKILSGLTPGLRHELVMHSVKDTIGKIPLFAETLNPFFQLEVFHMLKPISVAAGEVIYARGDPSHDLIFIIKGRVDVLSGYDGVVLYSIDERDLFGESVLTGGRRSATHRAGPSGAELYAIAADALRDLLNSRPREGRVVLEAVMLELRRKDLMQSMSLRLMLNHELTMRTQSNLRKHTDTIAALRLQLAWLRHTNAAGYKRAERQYLDKGPVGDLSTRRGPTPRRELAYNGMAREGEPNAQAWSTPAVISAPPIPSAPPINTPAAERQVLQGDTSGLSRLVKQVHADMEQMQDGHSQLRNQMNQLETGLDRIRADQADIKAKFDRLFAFLPPQMVSAA
jgi:CRP-like cAMP-binding protein